MKPKKILVKDLNDKIGPHSIRLKVIDKSTAQPAAKDKSLHYQRIVFQDEEGGRIKTTLYNDDIIAFDKIIQNKVEYDITNGKIKLMPEKYRLNAADNPFQLSIGKDTIIKQVEGSEAPIGPEYIPIDAIPRTITADVRYDVVGILIYVEPLRQLPRPNGQVLDVREMVIVDHSTTQPLIITAWAELATREAEQLTELVEAFPAIGFTSLKPSYHKGFSLSTTSSTYVKLTPEGEKVDALHLWSKNNQSAISIKRNQVAAARATGTGRVITTIQNLRQKKAEDTLQEERHWLHISIPEFDRKDVRFYIGCSQCGTGSDEDINVIYNYEACNRKAVSSVPRMTIKFQAIDNTGSFIFTSFTADSEKLLQTKTSELYTMEQQDQQHLCPEMEL